MSLERGIQIKVNCTEANENFTQIQVIIEDIVKDIATSLTGGIHGRTELMISGKFTNNDQIIDKEAIKNAISEKISHLAVEYTVSVATTSA